LEGVTVSLAGSSHAVRSAQLSVDLIRAVRTDQATVGLAVLGWVSAFAPDAVEALDEIMNTAAAQGLEVDRHLRLPGDRMLRVAIDPATWWLEMRIVQLEPAFRLAGQAMPERACRGIDRATGRVGITLDLPFEATLEPTGDGDRHVWLVVAEPGRRTGAVELAGTGWDAVGEVADPATGTTVIPGPAIVSPTTLTWTVRLADERRHLVEHRFVEGPPPRAGSLELQAEIVRDSIAFEILPAHEFGNEVCPEASGTGDPDVVLVREHTVAALLALALIEGRRPHGDAATGPRALDRRLAVMAEVRDWAVAEREWAEIHVAPHRWDHPVLRDWTTTVGALAVLATDLVATRLDDRGAERTAWRLVRGLVTTMDRRIAEELAPPPSSDPAGDGTTGGDAGRDVREDAVAE
jgi:hypothetical protein